MYKTNILCNKIKKYIDIFDKWKQIDVNILIENLINQYININNAMQIIINNNKYDYIQKTLVKKKLLIELENNWIILKKLNPTINREDLLNLGTYKREKIKDLKIEQLQRIKNNIKEKKYDILLLV